MSQEMILDGNNTKAIIGLNLTQQVDQMTSLGRAASHFSVSVDENVTDDGRPSDGGIMNHHDEEQPVDGDKTELIALSEQLLEIHVPEKINLRCDLQQGGAISIPKKIEGDVHLVTRQGPIHVQKLRGHAIHIETTGENDSAFASDLLEAQTLNIQIPDGRLRAKRIHANTVDIRIGSSSAPPTALLDEDDSIALCDISSFYLSGDANIHVNASHSDSRPVRIKSHHGAASVEAMSPKPSIMNEMTGETVPIVELGGVNGSCEIFVKSSPNDGDDDDDNSSEWVSCQVHFDSISPDSVSIIHAEKGNVNVTVDRKVESDMRFISASNIKSVDIDALVGDETDDEDREDLAHVLRELDQTSSETDANNEICIQTRSFTPKDNGICQQSYDNISFVNGWVENKSTEPDSRFDRKLRGEGGGKIRLDGAAAQALHGFDKKQSDIEKGAIDQFLRPLVVVAASKKITLETLSWLGNIARRYGMDDSKDKEDLGRTATRRGRALETDR
jgi:hypothetical protein